MAGLRARRRPRIPSRSKGGAVEPKGGANAGWCHGHGWVSLKCGGCRGRHRTELHWGAWCLKPYPGKPDVRNFRGGAGNVTCGARASALPDRNASERRAGLETRNAGADPPLNRGRPTAVREVSDKRTGSFPPGYWRRHVCKMDDDATREALSAESTCQPEIREDQFGPSGWRRGP